jgi:hypothetical protein
LKALNVVNSSSELAIYNRKQFTLSIVDYKLRKAKTLKMFDFPNIKVKYVLLVNHEYLIVIKDTIDRLYKMMLNDFVRTLKYTELKNNPSNI